MCAPGRPPVSTTVPFAGSDADAIVFAPPSGSVSLASTSIAVAAESSATVAVSSTAVGASSTQVTVTDTVAVEPPLSVYVKLSGPAVVGVGLVGQARARARRAARQHDRAVRRIRRRRDRLRPAVDVGVVGQHVDRARARVLPDRGGVVDRRRRVVGVAHRDRELLLDPERGRAVVGRPDADRVRRAGPRSRGSRRSQASSRRSRTSRCPSSPAPATSVKPWPWPASGSDAAASRPSCRRGSFSGHVGVRQRERRRRLVDVDDA